MQKHHDYFTQAQVEWQQRRIKALKKIYKDEINGENFQKPIINSDRNTDNDGLKYLNRKRMDVVQQTEDYTFIPKINENTDYWLERKSQRPPRAKNLEQFHDFQPTFHTKDTQGLYNRMREKYQDWERSSSNVSDSADSEEQNQINHSQAKAKTIDLKQFQENYALKYSGYIERQKNLLEQEKQQKQYKLQQQLLQQQQLEQVPELLSDSKNVSFSDEDFVRRFQQHQVKQSAKKYGLQQQPTQPRKQSDSMLLNSVAAQSFEQFLMSSNVNANLLSIASPLTKKVNISPIQNKSKPQSLLQKYKNININNALMQQTNREANDISLNELQL